MNGLCTPGLNSTWNKWCSCIFLRFTVEHFLLQPSSSCHFSCTWAHLRPDCYRANSFNDKELKSPRCWKHRQHVAAWSGTDSAYRIELLCQGRVTRQELAGTVLTSWGVSHHTHQHTRWRGQDILTQSTPTGAVQDHYGFSLLWLCSMKMRQGFEHCICHSKTSYRVQSTATRGSGHQQAAEAFCWSLRWMRWAFISFFSFLFLHLHTNPCALEQCSQAPNPAPPNSPNIHGQIHTYVSMFACIPIHT